MWELRWSMPSLDGDQTFFVTSPSDFNVRRMKRPSRPLYLTLEGLSVHEITTVAMPPLHPDRKDEPRSSPKETIIYHESIAISPWTLLCSLRARKRCVAIVYLQRSDHRGRNARYATDPYLCRLPSR